MRRRASLQAKKPALSGTAEHGLRLYSLAAAAASVSVLALAQPAEGEIIIKNKTIPIPANSAVFLDLNGDGISDFEFFQSNYTHPEHQHQPLVYAGGRPCGQPKPGHRQKLLSFGDAPRSKDRTRRSVHPHLRRLRHPNRAIVPVHPELRQEIGLQF